MVVNDVAACVSDGSLLEKIEKTSVRRREQTATALVLYHMRNPNSFDLPAMLRILSYDTPGKLGKILSASFKSREADLGGGGAIVFGWNSSGAESEAESEILSGISWKSVSSASDASTVLSKITWV